MCACQTKEQDSLEAYPKIDFQAENKKLEASRTLEIQYILDKGFSDQEASKILIESKRNILNKANQMQEAFANLEKGLPEDVSRQKHDSIGAAYGFYDPGLKKRLDYFEVSKNEINRIIDSRKAGKDRN